MKDFITKNRKELIDLLSEKKIALRAFRFDIAGSKVRNVKSGMLLKKDIARILTLMNNK